MSHTNAADLHRHQQSLDVGGVGDDDGDAVGGRDDIDSQQHADSTSVMSVNVDDDEQRRSYFVASVFGLADTSVCVLSVLCVWLCVCVCVTEKIPTHNRTCV